ncbi:MAG: tyrosine-type recombinase/integrase [Gemmatimonadetes bacterium]|nr:tyrosine-type recombinase/integrase [Gemmatimonadota bacterium]
MHPWLTRYLDWLEATNHAPATRRNCRRAVERFLAWAGPEGDPLPGLLPDTLEAYQSALARACRPDGAPLGWGTRAEYLGALRAFLRWAVAQGLLAADPTRQLILPRRPVQLPRAVLSHREATRVLRQPDATTPLGLRDRALLELLYSSGIRRAEAAGIRSADRDPPRRVLLVRAGKGQRDRAVPVGRRALQWLGRYLRRARPRLAGASDPGWLFLSTRGTRVRLNHLSARVARYVAGARVGKPGSCHLFRHSMATLPARWRRRRARRAGDPRPREPFHHRPVHPPRHRAPAGRARAGPSRRTARRLDRRYGGSRWTTNGPAVRLPDRTTDAPVATPERLDRSPRGQHVL